MKKKHLVNPYKTVVSHLKSSLTLVVTFMIFAQFGVYEHQAALESKFKFET